MEIGSHHSAETRKRMRLRNLAHWTPERRAEASKRTRQRMNNPVVRARISEGMRRAVARGDDCGGEP
jgi:hypothetical protein